MCSSLFAEVMLDLREGQCTLSKNSDFLVFFGSALLCFGDSLKAWRVILQHNLMFTRHRGNLTLSAFLFRFERPCVRGSTAAEGRGWRELLGTLVGCGH